MTTREEAHSELTGIFLDRLSQEIPPGLLDAEDTRQLRELVHQTAAEMTFPSDFVSDPATNHTQFMRALVDALKTVIRNMGGEGEGRRTLQVALIAAVDRAQREALSVCAERERERRGGGVKL